MVKPASRTLRGQCHCGAVRLDFRTARPLAPRACQCGFCRKHGARTVADPSGSATLTVDHSALNYRFGTGATDFIVCGVCGVYVGALMEAGGRLFTTLNLNAFDASHLELAAAPVSYDGETPAAKAERRRLSWTPVRVLAG